MRWPSPERVAQVSIGVLFLATLRTLGEYYRLRWTSGPETGLKAFEPFIGGLLVAVTGTIVAVTLYFAQRFRAVVWATAIIIAALIVYKLMFIPARGGPG